MRFSAWQKLNSGLDPGRLKVAMNLEKSPLTNKLILLVLSLILVCLVLLVVRAYGPGLAPEPVPAVASVEMEVPPQVEASTPEPAPVFQKSIPRSASRSTTVVQRQVPVIAPPAQETPPSLPEFVEAALPTHTTLVNLPAGVELGAVGAASTDGRGPEILGTVSLLGSPKPEVPIDLGPQCGRINRKPVTTRHFVVSPEGRLANVVLCVSAGLRPGFSWTLPETLPLLDQVGCMFEPYVLAVQTNERFRIRNSDPELHNVHATPRLNKEFNFAQVADGPGVLKSFSKAESFIRLKCDVHPWMFAYVSVLDSPFFAVTDTNGGFRLPAGIPAGRYRVTAAHLKAGLLEKEVTLGDGEQRTLHFQFVVPGALSPQEQASRSL